MSLLHKEVVKAFSNSHHAVVITVKAHAISRLTFPVGQNFQNARIEDLKSVFCV